MPSSVKAKEPQMNQKNEKKSEQKSDKKVLVVKTGVRAGGHPLAVAID